MTVMGLNLRLNHRCLRGLCNHLHGRASSRLNDWLNDWLRWGGDWRTLTTWAEGLHRDCHLHDRGCWGYAILTMTVVPILRAWRIPNSEHWRHWVVRGVHALPIRQSAFNLLACAIEQIH